MSVLNPQLNELTKRCAIYTRKSVVHGLEQEFNSLDAQRSICSSYIASQRQRGGRNFQSTMTMAVDQEPISGVRPSRI